MDASPGILIAVLTASLLGSLHCAGMCGGLVLFAVGADGKMEKRSSLHVAYHLGRAIGYAALGGAAGALGATIDIAGALNSNIRTSAMIAGALMVVLGLVTIARNLGVARGRVGQPRLLKRLGESAHRWAFGLAPAHRALMVGVLTPLLPCGWLYAFAVVAAGTGSPALGVLVLLAFWLGTVPVLGAVGVGLQSLTAPMRRRLPQVAPFIVVVMGLVIAFGRVGVDA
ncbi:MAG: sulfite exporter TauE/SafE family protein, partial [Planctomycetota bacterium]